MAWTDTTYAAHERIEDQNWLDVFDAMAGLPRMGAVEFDLAAAPLRDYLRRLSDSGAGREHDTYRFDLTVNADQLWAIPDSFRAKL